MLLAYLNVIKEVIDSYIKVDVVLEVLKEAAMVVVTTLPDDVHFYCIYLFKARTQHKQHYWSTIMVVTFHLKLYFRSSNLIE